MFYKFNEFIFSTAVWFVLAFPLSVIGTIIVMTIVCFITPWGRKFWLINKDIVCSRSNLRWWAYFLVSIACALLMIRFLIVFADFFKEIMDSLHLEKKSVFIACITALLLLECIKVGVHTLQFFMHKRLILLWRYLLTVKVQSRWIEHDNYYLFHFLKKPLDNPDQRIDLDTDDFAEKSVTLFFLLFSAVVLSVEAITQMWQISPRLDIGQLSIPKVTLIFLLSYLSCTILLTIFVGKPLIRWNFTQKILEANYRYALAKLRINSKEVALLRDGQQQDRQLHTLLDSLICGARRIISQQTWLNALTIILDCGFAKEIPYVIQAPAFFQHTITLGQIAENSIIGNNITVKIYHVLNSYSDFTQYLATTERLTGFLNAATQTEKINLLSPTPVDSGFRVQDFSVCTPDDRVIIDRCSLSCKPGQSLLITGASGIGKSSTMLALAGLWPYMSGTVYLPDTDQCMFVPQQWYLPAGTLRSLFYVRTDDGPSDAQICAMLDNCGLGGLGELSDLDCERNWSAVLSPGQIQRIAIARAVLACPKVLFLDEATSALDEDVEARMYQLIYDQLPECAIVSIAHRSTIRHYHTHVLHILPEGHWQLTNSPSSLNILL